MKKFWFAVLGLALASNLAATIHFSTPIPGTRHTAGMTLAIRWTANEHPGARLSIWVGMEGAPLIQIGRDIPAERGILNWRIPRTLYGDKWRVSIFQEGTPTRLGISPGFFSIIPPTRIRLLSPNGGERFPPYSTFIIRWEATGIVAEHNQEVQVLLCYYPGGCRTGEPTILIWSPTPGPRIGSGATGFRFVIPSSAPLSSAYFIRLKLQSQAYRIIGFDPGRYDESDGCFTVAR